ncbi:YceI family protein [Paucibacter sp. B2R-40]|uniref:YceI family protein n=1 Tax=Paucibacter sp. B2R-40 TaxID=2893554 RepID=UPI0021E3C6DC|nr:YceI family protein [Paucibacter sp. B2R-40]MCV2356951.1 YceI family protein [Paucibacter sp. B2R-40]
MTAWAPDFADLRQLSQGQALWPVDAGTSTLSVHVFRGGRAAQLGHNHVLNAPKLAGLLRLNASECCQDLDLKTAAFELALRLDELELDAAASRATLGVGWASAISPEMIAATRRNMLGEAGLQASSYPLLRVRSLRISGAYPKLAALVEIELHGHRQRQWLALNLSNKPGGGVQARGTMVISQSEFGLTPFSVAGGLLAVQDELLIEFDLLARPSTRPD